MNLKKALLFIFILNPIFSFSQYRKIAEGIWEGTASYYHHKFNGRRTANGEIFSNTRLTCANNFLPLGSKIRVINVKNGRSVEVRVNDRLAKTNKRLVDLSKAAAEKLGFIRSGLTKVRIEVLKRGKNRYHHNVHVLKEKKENTKEDSELEESDQPNKDSTEKTDPGNKKRKKRVKEKARETPRHEEPDVYFDE